MLVRVLTSSDHDKGTIRIISVINIIINIINIIIERVAARSGPFREVETIKIISISIIRER